jgi:glycosyltransferase involved in cell wall biosynthesis
VRRPRVAILSDLREEGWHAMDLVAEMLLLNLRAPEARAVDAIEVRPRLTPRLTRLPLLRSAAAADTADRILNRVWDYPRWLAPQVGEYDLFHIVDHSYAHLARQLPPGRTVISCHDVDAFRGVLPGTHGGSFVERALGRRLLEGLLCAQRILCCTDATRKQLIASGVVQSDRVLVVPHGVHPACSSLADAVGDRDAAALIGEPDSNRVDLLHVGSTIPRKRIDVLLQILAALGSRYPRLRLIRVGGPFTTSQQRLVQHLQLQDRIVAVPFVTPRVLSAIYRRAALLLQTSDREGFGLPVAEAMACGTPVVASDLLALREVGGTSSTYAPVGEIEAWVSAVSALLDERARDLESWRRRRSEGIAWARRFDWRTHTMATVAVYREVLDAAQG